MTRALGIAFDIALKTCMEAYISPTSVIGYRIRLRIWGLWVQVPRRVSPCTNAHPFVHDMESKNHRWDGQTNERPFQWSSLKEGVRRDVSERWFGRLTFFKRHYVIVNCIVALTMT